MISSTGFICDFALVVVPLLLFAFDSIIVCLFFGKRHTLACSIQAISIFYEIDIHFVWLIGCPGFTVGFILYRALSLGISPKFLNHRSNQCLWFPHKN